MKRLLASMAVVALTTLGVVGLSVPAYGGGGNSANALMCLQGGWQSLFRADGSAFTNEGDCVSYGAQGGALFEASPALQACASVGGTFGTDDKTGATFSTILWSCNDWPFANDSQTLLNATCLLESPSPVTLGPIVLAPIPPGSVFFSTIKLGDVGDATCAIK